MTEATKKIPEALQSMNIAEHNIDQLKQLFPHVFKEGKIDFDDLKRALGEWVEPSKERFGLNWPGKAECMKVIQEPSMATLKPVREESVNFDDTENLFIEGDNLEVLKLLQKAYFGKIKMIYIDPPYNTGDEFIYPDKYSEGLQTYLEYSGQVDSEGRKFSTNTEAEGRFHSRWLNMMYPRLYLARNLLREDGVIFISIDDHEQSNLKALCDQVFGEENFLGTILWKKKTNGNNMGYIPPVHDYFIAYAKNSLEDCLIGFPLDEEYIKKNYSNPDNDPRGDWTTSDLSANHKGPYFPITNPATGEVHYPPKGRYWALGEKDVENKIKEGRIIFGKSGNGKPVQKKFLNERENIRRKPESWWDRHGLNEDGSSELTELLAPKIFDHPKPSITIGHLCEISTRDDDIIMDFFAGSGSTAHAVYSLNKKDGGNRKFILVQLPEVCDSKSVAYSFGFRTIAEVSRARIKKVIEKINDSQLGLKCFKLNSSNFRIWDDKNIDQLEQQLTLHVDHIDKTAQPEDILYELLLKAGFELTTKIDKISLAGKDVYSVADGALLICLDKNITSELIDALAERDPLQVICLDEGFKGNDQLKTNAVQTFKSRAQSKETEIVFRTV